jgi:hypothetical protein
VCVSILGLWLSSDGAAHAAAPDLWQSHDDPLGFTVRHPPNWAAEIVQDELISVRNADGTAFVVVQPFFARDGATASGWVETLPDKLGSVFSNASVSNLQQVSYQPDEVIAEMRFDDGGEPGRALLLCVLDGRSGMLYALAGPERTFDKMRSVLVDVLSTFSFTTPTAPVGVDGGVSYVKWWEDRKSVV